MKEQTSPNSEKDSPESEDRYVISRKHARFHDENVPYHVIFRCLEGMMLLTPDPVLNVTIAGVIGKAQEHYKHVKLFAHAFLSNHVHLMIQGPADELPGFVRFIKSEISRRYPEYFGWSGPLWEKYLSTALPTEQSQLNCFRYILAQGVKEDLVARPEQWPGIHAAKHFVTGNKQRGRWLDGTRYGKAKHRAKDRGKPLPKKEDYTQQTFIELSQLPALAHLDAKTYRRQVLEIIDDIAIEERHRRGNKSVLGPSKIKKQRRLERRPVPKPPWFEERQRMICWANPNAPEVKAYVQQYWAFQRAFREASDKYLAGDDTVVFPPGAFRPPRFERIEARSETDAPNLVAA